MNAIEKILIIECSLLVVVIVFGLIVYNLRKQDLNNNNHGESKCLEKEYIILPPTNTAFVELQRHVDQLSGYDIENEETADDCTIIDETSNVAEVGRLYFSLLYEPMRRALTIKLIKGENLPTIRQDLLPFASKAYVNVQILCQKSEETSTNVKRSKIYQRAYTFFLQPNDFLSHVIHFEVSRFDRFSRKYDVAHVIVALSELQEEIVDLSREKLFAKEIIRNWNMSRKRRHSSDRLEPGLQLLQRDVNVRHRKSQMLWSKLSHAVHAGLFEERKLNPNESLQWDPFLIVQRYQFTAGRDTSSHSTSNENNSGSDVHRIPNSDQQHLSQEEVPRMISDVFHSSNRAELNGSEIENKYSSQQQRTLNQEFYRLVHSPSLARKNTITSWSIPETFRPRNNRVTFESASAIHERNDRHDRLHKLTSLSTNYREKILRKSRRRSHSRLTSQVSLHESLYLGKSTHHASEENERTHKRQRKTTLY